MRGGGGVDRVVTYSFLRLLVPAPWLRPQKVNAVVERVQADGHILGDDSSPS